MTEWLDDEGNPLAAIPPIGLRRGSSGRYDGQYRPEFSRVHLDEDLLWIAPLPVRYVLAVVGRRWSGKGAVVNYLQEKRGFAAHNLQRTVRQEAERRGLDPSSRAVRQQIGDVLRAEHLPHDHSDDQSRAGDGGYLARQALRRIRTRYARQGRDLEPPRRIVVGGFSHPDELEVFGALPDFHVLRVRCEDDARRDRAVEGGLLQRDFEAYKKFEFPGTQDLDADTTNDIFGLVDGFDADGKSAAPWAADCAQSTNGLMDLAETWAADQPGKPADLDASNRVFDIDSGNWTLAAVYDRVDAIAGLLDQRYLLRRP